MNVCQIADFLQAVGSWPAAREPEGSQSSVKDQRKEDESVYIRKLSTKKITNFFREKIPWEKCQKKSMGFYMLKK